MSIADKIKEAQDPNNVFRCAKCNNLYLKSEQLSITVKFPKAGVPSYCKACDDFLGLTRNMLIVAPE